MLLVALVAVGGLLTVVDQFQPINDADFFWHLKTGEWIWQHKALPSEDPFAYTTPRDLTVQQHFTLTSYWLSQITYFLLYQAGGFPAIVALRFALVGLLTLALLAARRGDPLVFAGVLVLALVALGLFPLERPQAFSFVLYVVLLHLLTSFRSQMQQERRGFAAVAAVPALMLLWANVHGAYLLGQATILLVLALEGVKFLRPELEPMPAASYRRLLLAGVLGLLFSLANPNTYHAIEYLRPPVAGSPLVNIEYQTTLYVLTRLNFYRVALYWLLLLLTLLGLLANWRKPDITMIALLAGLGVVSFFRTRYAPFFIVAAVPGAAASLSSERVVRWSRPFVVAAALLCAAYFGWRDRGGMIKPRTGGWVHSYFPEKEADFILANDLRGNMYNNPNWGGYLMWRLAPGRKVFSDGRSLDQPSYLSTVTIDNARPGPGPGIPAWRQQLDARDIQFVVTPLFVAGVMYPLVNALLQDGDWYLVFTGYNSLIFVRASPQNSRVILARGQPKDRFLDEMIAWYTRESAGDPGSAFLHLTRGELLFSRRRFAEARAAYQRVLQLAPFNAVARERLRAIP